MIDGKEIRAAKCIGGDMKKALGKFVLLVLYGTEDNTCLILGVPKIKGRFLLDSIRWWKFWWAIYRYDKNDPDGVGYFSLYATMRSWRAGEYQYFLNPGEFELYEWDDPAIRKYLKKTKEA